MRRISISVAAEVFDISRSTVWRLRKRTPGKRIIQGLMLSRTVIVLMKHDLNDSKRKLEVL